MRRSKPELVTYIVLRVLVLAVLTRELVLQRWDNVFLCVLTLLLFLIPSLVERRLKVELPGFLEIVILIFIFAAEILGEIGEFYLRVNNWDTLLHTVNGFLMAAIGFAMIDVLNRHPRFHFSLSPAFVAFVAFCFSMTIGIVWEFVEYGADHMLQKDMQKDSIVETISSVTLNPSGANTPVVVRDIQRTVITGVQSGVVTDTVIPGGYLDIGLNDTMKDLIVNCIGALAFSVFGTFYLKGHFGAVEKLIPRLLTKEEFEEEENLRKGKVRRRRMPAGAPPG
jgi:hypothetical protein